MLQGSLVRFLPWTQNLFELSLCLLLCNPQMTLFYCLLGTRGFTIDMQTLGNCFDIWWLCRTYPKWTCLLKLKLILLDVIWFTFENGNLLYQILFKCDLPGEGSPDKDCRCWLTFRQPAWRSSYLTLKITSAQVVETSVNNKNNKSPSQD